MDSMVEETANQTSASANTDSEQAQQVATSQPATIVVTAIPNQPVQVQSVIQASNQPSVIQTAPLQAVQVHVATVQDGSEDGGSASAVGVDSESETKKRRDILSRRPSYRKILNDLSSDAPGVPRIDEETSSQEDSEAASNITSIATSTAAIQAFQTTTNAGSGAQTIQIAAANEGIQQAGLQTLTMTNASGATPGTIVQYSQSQDGSQQFFVPTAAGEMQAYQIRASTSLPQGVVMAAPSNLQTQQQLAEEASRKRELRLMKNREAARECRRKKKEYVKCLENRVAVLENQNKALIEELKALKDLYCHKSD